MHDEDELTGPTALTEFMARPAVRNAVLGIAGAVAIWMAVRAFQHSAPYMLCIAGGVIAVAGLIVLRPLINKALWDVNLEDPDFEGEYFKLRELRMAPLLSLMAMVGGYVVSSFAWTARTQDGANLASSPSLAEIGVVVVAYALAAGAVMSFARS